MTIDNSYEQHVAIIKELKMADSFYEARASYKEGFEAIYEKAKEEDIGISSAKDFLNSLSKEELSDLQNYALLVDDIDVDKLNDEGAYNLLLHHYEKYDFNKDGIVSDGIAKTSPLIPINMPNDEKEVLVQTINEMDEKDRFMAMAMLNPPKIIMFADGAIGTQENSEWVDYEAIMERINRILNPMPGEYASAQLQNTISLFKELFDKNMDELNEQKKMNQTANANDAHLMKAKLSKEEV